MARELETWAIDAFTNDTTISTIIGRDPDNIPAIFPYHAQDKNTERVPYPHITIARFGSWSQEDKFGEQFERLSTAMDNPRFAVCCWSTVSVDECYQLYGRVDAILRGQFVANIYFGAYRVQRTTMRDDLFDDVAKAYHLHSEYRVWIQRTATAQPFS